MFKKWIEKGQKKRYDKFLSEYKNYTDEQLWDWYCGLDMDGICGTGGNYGSQMFRLIEDELEIRNNPKYPTRGR